MSVPLSVLAFIARYRFPVFIVGVVCLALVMTVVSVGLYVSSGASSLDLSRPGYESLRSQVTEPQMKNEDFPATGVLDQSAYDSFVKLYQKQRQQTDKLGRFDDQSLSDESLHLVSGDTTTPSE